MATVLEYIIGHFPLVLLVLALILAAREWTGQALCRYLLLLPIGLGGLWGFLFHAFAPDYAAEKIGWLSTPFQYEVAAANLGMGIAGLVAYWRGWDFAFAVTLMVLCFLEGAAFVHLIEILFEDNYAPGNAGTILYTDILIPIFLLLALCLWKLEKKYHPKESDSLKDKVETSKNENLK